MAYILVTVQFLANTENFFGTPQEYKTHLEHIAQMRNLPSDDIVEDVVVVGAKILPEPEEE